jgi:hypothetical protein
VDDRGEPPRLGVTTWWTPRTHAAARAGTSLVSLCLHCISTVLDSVIAAVPAARATSPFPMAASTARSLWSDMRHG